MLSSAESNVEAKLTQAKGHGPPAWLAKHEIDSVHCQALDDVCVSNPANPVATKRNLDPKKAGRGSISNAHTTRIRGDIQPFDVVGFNCLTPLSISTTHEANEIGKSQTNR